MASAGKPPDARLWSFGRNVLPISGRLTPGNSQGCPSQFSERDARHANWSALAQISSHEPLWIFSTVFNRWPTTSPGKTVAVTLVTPSAADIGVRPLAARRNRRGQVEIAAVVHATAAMAAVMRITRDSHLIAAERMVFTRAGTRVVSLVDSAAAGEQLHAYNIRLEADDPWPQDNSATVVLPARRLSHVLWVDGRRPRVSVVQGELRIAAAGLGLLVSSISSTMQQALLGTFVLVMPCALLSGLTTPISNMPRFVQKITLINPLRYDVQAAREAFLEGANVHQLMPELIPMAIIAVLSLLTASWMFRRIH